MLFAIIQYISGYLKIRVQGYSPERFLNLCSHYGIYLWNLTPDGHAYEMNITVRGFRKLRPIIRKTRTRVSIVERKGFPFFLHKYRRRKIFFAGILLFFAFLYGITFFVWKIQIDGNKRWTDEALLEYLSEENIQYGMRKSKVDCEQIVKDIRGEFDDIIWVSAHMKGTKLVIQVKENSDKPVNSEIKEPPIDIKAKKSGTILSIVTRKGTPLVHVGDTVNAGDVLVSGTVDILNDAKEITAYQYQTADADVIAKTEQTYQNAMPLSYEIKKTTGKFRIGCYLKTGDTIICFAGKRFPYSHSIITTREYQPTILESFPLPFCIGIKKIAEYSPVQKKWEETEYQSILSEDFSEFCRNLEKKGVQILENNVRIYKETDSAVAQGTLILAEPIGTEEPGMTKELPPAVDESENQEGN